MELIGRPDAAMYREKAATRGAGDAPKRKSLCPETDPPTLSGNRFECLNLRSFSGTTAPTLRFRSSSSIFAVF